MSIAPADYLAVAWISAHIVIVNLQPMDLMIRIHVIISSCQPPKSWNKNHFIQSKLCNIIKKLNCYDLQITSWSIQIRACLFSKSSLARLQEFWNSSICLYEIKRKNLFKSTCPTGSFTCPGLSGSVKRRALHIPSFLIATSFYLSHGENYKINAKQLWRLGSYILFVSVHCGHIWYQSCIRHIVPCVH